MYKHPQEGVRRASMHQLESMLQFMEQHPEIGNGKIMSCYDLTYRKQKWLELTNILNSAPGQPRSVDKWQKAWQDWRYNTRKKSTYKRGRRQLTFMEQRLLTVCNTDNIDIESYKANTLNANQNNQAETSEERNNRENETSEEWPQEEYEMNPINWIEVSDIKREVIDENLEHQSEDQLNVPEIQISNIASIASNPLNKTEKKLQKKKYVYCDTRENHRIAKYLRSSTVSMKKMCVIQRKTSSKLVSILKENSRTMQSLAESQMRQAEALERQVSLEESRNSILKSIASILSTLKKP